MGRTNTVDYTTHTSHMLKEFHFNRNVRTSKYMISHMLVLCIGWTMILRILQIPPVLIVAMLGCALSYTLHQKHKHVAAQMLFFIVANLVLFVSGLFDGPTACIYLILLSVVGVLYLVFDYKTEKIWLFRRRIRMVYFLWTNKKHRGTINVDREL